MDIRAPLEAEGANQPQSQGGHRMKLHGNARTCPNSRRLIVARVRRGGWSVTAAAEAAGVTERTVRVVRALRRAEGEAGLLDRSSAPPRSAPSGSPAERVEAIEPAPAADDRRRDRRGARAGAVDGLGRGSKRVGLGKRSRLAPPEPPNRYERRPPWRARPRRRQAARPHLGAAGATHGRAPQEPAPTAQAGQGSASCAADGCEYVHVMVDDHSRLAYAEVLPTLTARYAVGFSAPRVAGSRGSASAIKA